MTADPLTDLRVDHRQRPQNVAPESRPRYSWRRDADRRGARQTAYRVLVARDRETAADREGDVWDSGRVESGDAAADHGGVPLAADETYFWTVRVWDEDGAPSPWATPVAFGTSLGGDHEWAGEWITHQPGPGDTNGYRSAWRDPEADADPAWVQVDLGAGRDLSAVELHPAAPFDGVETPDGFELSALFSEAAEGGHPITARGPDGFGFPVRYRVEAATDPAFEDATVVADRTDEDQPNPGRDPVVLDADVRARYVRLVAVEPYSVAPASGGPSYHSTKTAMVREEYGVWAVLALASLGVRGPDGDDLASGATVTGSSSVESGAWGRDRLADGARESSVASSSPLLRTEFDLSKPIARARLHVATLGWGEAHVNGERVGDAVLDPSWTDYDERVLYETKDVTDYLSEGANALGLWLGRGWFSKNDYAWTGYGSPRALAHLSVTYEDGTTRTVGTSPDWAATESPVLENDVYDGETYDARREQDGWAEPGFDDADWDNAAAASDPGGDRQPQQVEPARVVERIALDSVEERDGGAVVDFGQNLTGWVELEVAGAEAGDEIVLRHAEAVMDDGDLATVDLRSADATDRYVARGDDVETYTPRFTYHGFRYARVEGYPGDLDSDDVTAAVVHSDLPRRGTFTCANDDLEAVQHAAEWSLRGNSVALPTGCAQRDERTGWTGDAYLSARALQYNFDAGRFHAKWLRDHEDAQSRHGYVGDTVPLVHGTMPGDPSWTTTRVAVPWFHYQFYGDERLLREQYEGMRRHVDYWHSLSEAGYLAPERGNYGDWLAFENTREGGPIGEPLDLFNTASHYRATRMLADVADVLGLDADAERYADRAATVAESFNDRFFDAEAGAYDPGTQAAQAVPLSHCLVPDGREDDVVATLVDLVRDAGDRLLTGFLGTRALLSALAEHGHVDLAYHLVSQPERPGWVYMVRNGATTLWERWNSDDEVGSGMNSYNHHQFAYVSEWFYGALAGLGFAGGETAADEFDVAPRVPADLDGAAGSVETPLGTLASEWERTDGGLELAVTVPWNATATVRVPLQDGATAVSADGDRLWSAGDGVADALPDGVRGVEPAEDGVQVAVDSGTYAFLASGGE